MPSNIRGLYKRGDTWYCRITGANKELIRRRLSTDRATAIIILAEMRKNVELQKAGILPEKVVKVDSDIEPLRDLYLKHLNAGSLSKSTVEAFRHAYKAVIEKNNIKRVSGITTQKIEKWAAERLASGVRGQTVNAYVGFIRNFLEWARRNKHIRENPLDSWEAVRTNEPRARRDLQPEEVQAILNTEQDDGCRLRWYVYFFTGLRATAGASLRWEWIQWESRHIHLPVESNKSNRQLSIPIHPDLFQALVTFWEQRGKPECGSVFPDQSIATIRAHFRKTCRAAGINTHGVTLHSARHTLATRLYESTGRNLKAVQEILGHADALTTMRYLHTTAQEKVNAINSVDYRGDTAPAEAEREPGIIQFPAARRGEKSGEWRKQK